MIEFDQRIGAGMLNLSDVVEMCRIPADKKVKLQHYPTVWDGQSKYIAPEVHQEAKQLLGRDLDRLIEVQEILYAARTWSVLVILQGMDASGKDGTIGHVMAGVHPQGVKVASFKSPTPTELAHDFMWRSTKELPERGQIGIFNRSYYEEVLIVKVHPEMIAQQRVPGVHPEKKAFWRTRFKSINQFERHLARNGTLILKFFLHLSKEEQKRRFMERIENPKKNWKFSAQDVAEREHWDEYITAYEEMLNATSTKQAPWYIVPADDKPTARLLVAQILSHSLQKLDLHIPDLTPSQRAALIECKAKLEAEGS